MKSQKILIYALAMLIIGMTLFVSESRVKADSPAEFLYEKVRSLSANGDRVAESVLQELEEFLQRQGIRFNEVKSSKLEESYTVNNMQVRVKGIRPFYIKIHNEPKFLDHESLNEYVNKRREVLAELAKQDPERLIEVSISPSEHVTLAQFWGIKEVYDLDVDDLSLDVFILGKWDSMIWVREEEDTRMPLLIDFSKGQIEVDKQLRDLLLSRPPLPGEGTAKKPDLGAVEFGIRYARGKILSKNCLLLDENRSIMLVDPLTDLKDAFNPWAVDVRVVQMPHLYVAKNFIRGEIYPTGDSQNILVVPNRMDAGESLVPKVPQALTSNTLVPNKRLVGYGYASSSGWKANDFGNDDPDNAWWIYAPNSITHDMWWYDYDNSRSCDWVLDWQMDWWEGNANLISAPDWFRKYSYLNLCHEIRANHRVYEAHSYISTDLPSVTHNEDSNWFEEKLDGYEEKEVGMDRPWELNPNYRYRLWTLWCPLNNGNSSFESESELTGPSPYTGTPWYPYHWDQLGKMWAYGAQ